MLNLFGLDFISKSDVSSKCGQVLGHWRLLDLFDLLVLQGLLAYDTIRTGWMHPSTFPVSATLGLINPLAEDFWVSYASQI